MNADNFTPSQVGTLLEAMDKKIDLLTEIVLPLKEDMSEVKGRLSKVEFRLTCVEDAVRVAIPSLAKRVTALETKVG